MRLKEFNVIKDPNWDMYPLRGGVVNQINTKLGTLDVYREEDNINVYYWIAKDKEPVCFIGLQKLTPYYMMRNAFSVISHKGLATELSLYIIKHENTPIFSDFNMTEGGAKLWDALRKFINVQIISFDTLEIFNFDDVGIDKTKNDEIVLHPKDDTRPEPNKLDNIQKNDQKFMFIANPMGNINENLINHKTSLLQPYMFFGYGD